MPKPTHHVIYIPGIGDYRSLGQRPIVAAWRLLGLAGRYRQMTWIDHEPFAPKLERILSLVDELAATGEVSIVGVSAGGGAAINAYARRQNKVSRVVLVCGKVHHPETVSPAVYARNPAFKESAYLVEASLAQIDQTHRARILSIHPLADHSVPPSDTIISGAVESKVPTTGHIMSIAYTITLGSPRIARFIKTGR
jgi:pimeloyl-ACP methyl ester carboxylesterase